MTASAFSARLRSIGSVVEPDGVPVRHSAGPERLFLHKDGFDPGAAGGAAQSHSETA